MNEFLFFLMNILSLIVPAYYLKLKNTLNYYHNTMNKILEVSKLIVSFSLLFGFVNFILTIPIDMTNINDIDKLREQVEEKTYSFINKLEKIKNLLILNIITSIFNTIINMIYGIIGTITYLLFKKYFRNVYN